MTAIDREAAATSIGLEPGDAALAASPGGGLGLRLVRNSLALLATQLVSWLLSFAVMLVVPRYLGPTTAGALFFAMSVVGLAGLTAGLANSMLVIKSVARAPDETGVWLLNGLIVRLAMGGLGLAVALLLLAVMGYDADTRRLVLLVGLAGVAGALAELASAGFQGLQWMGLDSLVGIVSRLLGAGATLALVFGQRPVEEIAAIGIPLALLQLAVQLAYLWRRGYRFGRPSLRLTRTIVSESQPFLLAGVCLVLYSQINPLLLSRLADERAVAWFAVPTRLLGTGLFVPTVLLGAAYPLLAQLYAVDPAAMLVQARRVLVGLLACATPIGLVLGFYGTPIVVALYGEEYRPSGPVLQVFGLVLVALYLNIFVSRLLGAMDQQKVWGLVMLAATVLALPINAIGITLGQRHGMASLGAAYGLLVTELAMLIPGLVVLGRHRLGWVCLGILAKSAVAAGAAASVLLLLQPLSAIGAPLAAVVGFIGTAWYTRIVPPADLARAWALTRHAVQPAASRWAARLRREEVRSR